MKIVGIVGSPHGLHGNTAALLGIVLSGAESKGAESEIVVIRGDEVKPCLGCNTCHIKGFCPQKDSFDAIREKIMNADGIILASPNYIFHVSAQMKVFLDRCSGVLHCLSFEGKYGAVVITSGGGGEEPISDYLKYFLATTGAMPVGSVWATMSQIQGQDFLRDTRDTAFSLGQNLVTKWKNKEIIPEWDGITSRFKEHMRSLMLQHKDEWPYEYEFWKKHRGLG